MQHARNTNLFTIDDWETDAYIEYLVERIQQIDYGQPWSDLDSYFAI